MAKLIRQKILILSSLFIYSIASGQTSHSPMEDVINALRNNRVQDMTQYFDNFVPINIDNTPSNYSHNQAEIVLQDFLEKNPPRDFIIINSGSPSELSKFAIGIFNTPNGHYNVYILLQKKDRGFLVKEIRFIKD